MRIYSFLFSLRTYAGRYKIKNISEISFILRGNNTLEMRVEYNDREGQIEYFGEVDQQEFERIKAFSEKQ